MSNVNIHNFLRLAASYGLTVSTERKNFLKHISPNGMQDFEDGIHTGRTQFMTTLIEYYMKYKSKMHHFLYLTANSEELERVVRKFSDRLGEQALITPHSSIMYEIDYKEHILYITRNDTLREINFPVAFDVVVADDFDWQAEASREEEIRQLMYINPSIVEPPTVYLVKRRQPRTRFGRTVFRPNPHTAQENFDRWIAQMTDTGTNINSFQSTSGTNNIQWTIDPRQP